MSWWAKIRVYTHKTILPIQSSDCTWLVWFRLCFQPVAFKHFNYSWSYLGASLLVQCYHSQDFPREKSGMPYTNLDPTIRWEGQRKIQLPSTPWSQAGGRWQAWRGTWVDCSAKAARPVQVTLKQSKRDSESSALASSPSSRQGPTETRRAFQVPSEIPVDFITFLHRLSLANNASIDFGRQQTTLVAYERPKEDPL